MKGATRFIDGLQLLLIAFKLSGIIDWSWILVLLPFWSGLALAIIAGLCKRR